jgi:type IV pilus assembly protein PilE
MPLRAPSRGFTLLELMIATGTAAILASIGWSSYSQVLQRVRRTEARLSLLNIQHAQEMFYARHNHYAGTLEPGQGLALSTRSDSGDYELSVISGADNQSYVATAVASAAGRQYNDHSCRSLSLDSVGTRHSRNSAGQPAAEAAACW